MKKLFLLIPALILSMMMNAKVTTIGPDDPTATVDNTLISALSSASDDDVIILKGGFYNESSDYLVFDKNVEVRAADGATPVIQLTTYIKVQGGKHPIISGLTFDGSAQGSRDQYFKFTDSNDNELELNNCTFNDVKKNIFRCESGKKFASLEVNNCKFINSLSNVMKLESSTCGSARFDGCEFSGTADIVINGKVGSHLDECVVNNCYFHDNAKQSIYFEASGTEGTETCDELTVTNSTFANTTALTNWISVIDIRPYSTASETVSDAIKVTVDHCTFYNNPCVDSGHANIRTHFLSDVSVSNSIFMHPTELAQRATYCDGGGTVSNCIAYNFTKDPSNYAHAWGPTVTSCAIADPLFTDAANGDFSFAGDWTTMELSPARGAANDGSDLGDPRWYSAEVLPTSNFVAPYTFVGAKAIFSGNISYNDVDEYIYYNNKSVCGTAKWKIHATRACNVKATLNMTDGSSSGHIFRVELLDANGNHVDEVAEPAQSSHDGNIDLPNTLAIPAEGDYTVILHNDQSWSSAKINSFTLAYVGGAVVTIPAEELLGTEAVLVNEGSLKVSKLENGDLKYGDNGTPDGEYVYWNINATKRGNMKVTLNVVAPGEGDPSGHQFLVELYSNLSGEPISSSAEASATSGTGARVLPNPINIPATGNYIVKLTNQKQWSSAILHSIQFEYLGGETMTIPAEALIGEEAVLVDEGHLKVSKLANGDLKYGDNGNPLDEYVYWNINATKYGRMNVTANVVAPAEGDPSGHQFLVELYTDLNESPIASSAEAESTSATGAIAMPALNIPATGNYIVKLTNQKQWSSAILHSIEFAYAGGEVVAVPGQILGADALLEKSGSKYMIRTEEGYLKSSNNGSPTSEWAVWNITASAGTMNVTLNLDPVTSSGHNYRVELYEGEVLKDYTQELETAELSDAVHSKGDVALEKQLVIPANGTYTIKLINRTQWSSMILQGITFEEVVAPTVVVLDEAATDNSTWVANVGGDAVNVQLTRTFKGGVYNSICVPFAASMSQIKAAFGDDVELIYLSETSLEGDMLNLIFADAPDIYQGTPYLIKPSADVVNPEFEGVELLAEEGDATGTAAVDFIGTFVKKDIAANASNLYLGTDNKLYFSDNAVTIKGLRAYFHVKGAASAAKRARIVAPNNMPTAIDLVNSENKAIKHIENGQVVIIRDGIRYNVMGIRLQ